MDDCSNFLGEGGSSCDKAVKVWDCIKKFWLELKLHDAINSYTSRAGYYTI